MHTEWSRGLRNGRRGVMGGLTLSKSGFDVDPQSYIATSHVLIQTAMSGWIKVLVYFGKEIVGEGSSECWGLTQPALISDNGVSRGR